MHCRAVGGVVVNGAINDGLPATKQPWTPRRLNRIGHELGSSSYLEIGLGRCSTFTRIDLAERTGVDPKFTFDESSVAGEGVRLKQMTSDAFFSGLPVAAEFDFVLIDGLHTFAQTYRDLCNTLLHAHPGTVILIDDTRPVDIFSAHPDREMTDRMRQEASIMSRSWHGDVFKVVFAIHDFHVGLDYRTIVGSGNPQTLVWRSVTASRVPRFDSLERISRLTYADLLEHEDVMQFGVEDAVIEAFISPVDPGGSHTT